jgi:hypothetical protein
MARLPSPMIAFLPLLLATTPVADTQVRRPATKVAVATVTIIQAEPVEVKKPTEKATPPDRQYRNRDAVPLVEFF